MAYYRTCPYCGSNNDPGEACDCRAETKKEPAPAQRERTRANGYPYTVYQPGRAASVQSKCENGDAYGVSLRPDAMAALYSHFAPELAEGRKAVKKDAHRLTCRISARLETADYEALQRLIEAEGYATTQDWLTATVRRYIAEAGEIE